MYKKQKTDDSKFLLWISSTSITLLTTTKTNNIENDLLLNWIHTEQLNEAFNQVRELLGGDNNNVAAVDEDDEQLQHSILKKHGLLLLPT